MKRLLTLLLLSIVCCTAIWADGEPEATFAKHLHEFGTIQEDGGPVSCTFEFTNTGSQPLLIIDAVASCGCTRPEFPTHPIKPGKKGKIKVTFSPLGRPGAFRKTVKVRTNDKNKRVSLVIEGTVSPSKNR